MIRVITKPLSCGKANASWSTSEGPPTQLTSFDPLQFQNEPNICLHFWVFPIQLRASPYNIHTDRHIDLCIYFKWVKWYFTVKLLTLIHSASPDSALSPHSPHLKHRPLGWPPDPLQHHNELKVFLHSVSNTLNYLLQLLQHLHRPPDIDFFIYFKCFYTSQWPGSALSISTHNCLLKLAKKINKVRRGYTRCEHTYSELSPCDQTSQDRC